MRKASLLRKGQLQVSEKLLFQNTKAAAYPIQYKLCINLSHGIKNNQMIGFQAEIKQK